jgi:hypothetical protein
MTIMVEWEEIQITQDEEAVSYNVYRSPDNTEGSYVLLANVPSNIYADATGSSTDYYEISGLDRFAEEYFRIKPTTQYSLTAPSEEIDTCKVFGTILDITGHPDPDVDVRFHICEGQAPQTIQSTGMNTKTISRSTNPDGYFEVELVQGAVVTMRIYGMRTMLKFAVPLAATIDFKDIVGTEIEIKNPF